MTVYDEHTSLPLEHRQQKCASKVTTAMSGPASTSTVRTTELLLTDVLVVNLDTADTGSVICNVR